MANSSPKKFFTPLVVAGILIGAANLLIYLVLTPALFNQASGLSIGGPLAMAFSWLEQKATGTNRIWSGVPPVFWVLIPGIFLGAMASAIHRGRLTRKSFRNSRVSKSQWASALVGGFLVGFGVLLADGCIVKHLLTGVPGLSLESVSVIAGIAAGVWGALKIQGKLES